MISGDFRLLKLFDNHFSAWMREHLPEFRDLQYRMRKDASVIFEIAFPDFDCARPHEDAALRCEPRPLHRWHRPGCGDPIDVLLCFPERGDPSIDYWF